MSDASGESRRLKEGRDTDGRASIALLPPCRFGPLPPWVKPIIRRATRADYEEFYGHPPVVTIRGIAGELDGRVLAFGGIARNPDGFPIIFFDMKDEARPYKKAIVKGALELMKIADDLPPGLPVAAGANPKEKTAPRFLTRLGFVPIGDGGYILRR